MNPEEACRQITEYWELVKECKAKSAFSGERRAAVKLLNDEHLPRVNRILRDLAPDLRPIRARLLTTISPHGRLWNEPSASSRARWR